MLLELSHAIMSLNTQIHVILSLLWARGEQKKEDDNGNVTPMEAMTGMILVALHFNGETSVERNTQDDLYTNHLGKPPKNGFIWDKRPKCGWVGSGSPKLLSITVLMAYLTIILG